MEAERDTRAVGLSGWLSGDRTVVSTGNRPARTGIVRAALGLWHGIGRFLLTRFSYEWPVFVPLSGGFEVRLRSRRARGALSAGPAGAGVLWPRQLAQLSQLPGTRSCLLLPAATWRHP